MDLGVIGEPDTIAEALFERDIKPMIKSWLYEFERNEYNDREVEETVDLIAKKTKEYIYSA